MRKVVLLNAELTAALAAMGHTDALTIGDCGLPIRGEAKRIDLALRAGVPSFIDTLKTVLTEMYVEQAILAEEIKEVSAETHRQILACLGNVPITYVNHAEFKNKTEHTVAVVRTGECTSYANIILVAGVPF